MRNRCHDHQIIQVHIDKQHIHLHVPSDLKLSTRSFNLHVYS